MTAAATNIGIDCANTVLLGGSKPHRHGRTVAALLQILAQHLHLQLRQRHHSGRPVLRHPCSSAVGRDHDSAFTIRPDVQKHLDCRRQYGRLTASSLPTPTLQADTKTITHRHSVASRASDPCQRHQQRRPHRLRQLVNFQSTALVYTGATITLLQGFYANNFVGLGGAVTTHVGVDVAALTGATTNIGIRNKSSLNQQGAMIAVNNTVTVTSNAGTVPVTNYLSTFTNSSDATMTITLATSGATDGQIAIVRIYDHSAAAETITWVNTANSGVSVPTTSNGSTTLPLTVGFMYNGATSKWRCLAVA